MTLSACLPPCLLASLDLLVEQTPECGQGENKRPKLDKTGLPLHDYADVPSALYIETKSK